MKLRSDRILGRVEYQSPPQTLWPWPNPHAMRQVCPVCNGKTTVPWDFYPGGLALRGSRVKCRSCNGRGIV